MSEWLSEDLIFSGDQYYKSVLDAIAHAKEQIDFETYIFDDDGIGKQFESALTAAAGRGVRVRLIVDGFGASQWSERNALKLARSGVDVRIYHPVRWSRIWSKLFSRLLMRFRGIRHHATSRGRSFFGNLNRRNHRKIVIVDGARAWVGSLNISAVHSEKFSGALAWRDTAAALAINPNTPPPVPLEALQSAFEFVYQRAHRFNTKGRLVRIRRRRFKFRAQTSLIFRLNYTLLLRRRHHHELAQIVRAAKSKIWITNAYLAPSKQMMRRLRAAAERGVDVRILLPRKSDVFFMPWVAGAHYGPLLRSGVRIFEYLPRFLHAKSVVIDHWAIVGSSNLNRRSMLKDFEVDVVLSRDASRLELEAQFARDL